jgi:hypothetical protein
LIGDSTDRERLALSFDSGDHLHPNAQRFAAALAPVMGNFRSLSSPLTQISPSAAASVGGLKATAKLAGEVAAVGGLGYGAWRIGKSWGWW